MKTASSIRINPDRPTKAQRNRGISTPPTTRLPWRLGMMVFVLTCGLIAGAQQPRQAPPDFQHMLNLTACGYGIGDCNESLLSPPEAAQVLAIRRRMNVHACGYGFGQCDERVLSPVEAAQVSAIRHRMNVHACGYGFGQCDERLLSPAEAAQVSAIRHRMNIQACGYGFGQCDESLLSSAEVAQVGAIQHRTVETAATAATSLDTTFNELLKALLPSVGAPVAENGSYYGEPNKNGVPKTVLVNGYTRSNGTYVRGYYRSAPGTNPVR